MKETFGLTRDEYRLLSSLRTPRKIQDFLETVPINFEPEGDTCLSPRRVLRERRAHCIEAAMLAALAFRIQGARPLLLDLEAAPFDQDHVVALFRKNGKWGAISKSNHSTLRYRDPVYRTVRELALSYIHEYTDDIGRKSLRAVSAPVDLSRFDRQGWMTAEEDVWYVPEHLATVRHVRLLGRADIAHLRRTDAVELDAGDVVSWKDPRAAP